MELDFSLNESMIYKYTRDRPNIPILTLLALCACIMPEISRAAKKDKLARDHTVIRSGHFNRVVTMQRRSA